MNVGFGNVRQFEVDHPLHVIHINTARGDIGSHQHPGSLLLEVGQRPLPDILTFVAVNGLGLYIILQQHFNHLVGSMLGAGENQRRTDIRVLQQVDEQGVLVALVDKEDVLLNGVNRGG